MNNIKRFITLFLCLLILGIPSNPSDAASSHTHVWKCYRVGNLYISEEGVHEVPGPAAWAQTTLCNYKIYSYACVQVCDSCGTVKPSSGHSHVQGASHSVSH